MLYIALSLACALAAVLAATLFKHRLRWPRLTAAALGVVAVVSFVKTSYVWPDGGEVALLDRGLLCAQSPDRTYIARAGECGRQARVIKPGFHFSPFINVVNQVSYVPMLEVPDGYYATLKANDGAELAADRVAASTWPQDVFEQMLDAEFFLDKGGVRGPQAAILKPGVYPLNTYLWEPTIAAHHTRTEIPTGHVGVVRSRVESDSAPAFFGLYAGVKTQCDQPVRRDSGQLSAVLVNVGCLGVWTEALPSGSYFINKNLYDVVIVDTRVQNWTYKGGYIRRRVDLNIDSTSGRIEEVASSSQVAIPSDATGDAIHIKVEGWTLHQELRVQVRIRPEDAPLVVAAVGDLAEVEDRIVTPWIRSTLRNIGGSRIEVTNQVAYDEAVAERDALEARLAMLSDVSIPASELGLNDEQRATEMAAVSEALAGFELPDKDAIVIRPTRVLDFQDERDALETLVADQVRDFGAEVGLDVVAVKLGNVEIPPELLLARKRQQLAGQQRRAYVQMRAAEVARQATEAARELANRQAALVSARVAVQVAEQYKLEQAARGEASRAYDEAAAEGRRALTDVLGADRVALLQALEITLQALKEEPRLIRLLPDSLSTLIVGGETGDLTALGALLKEAGGVPTTNRP